MKDTSIPLAANKPAEEAVKLDAFSVSAAPNRGFGFSGGLVGTQVMSDDQAKQQLVVTTNESAEKNRGFLSGLFGRNNADDEKKAKAEVAPTTTLKDIPVAYSVITKEFNDSMTRNGFVGVASSPSEFAEFIKKDTAKVQDVIRRANVHVD